MTGPGGVACRAVYVLHPAVRRAESAAERAAGVRFAPYVVMTSRWRVGRHPVHPILVLFPLGFWVFSLFCDLVPYMGGHDVATWRWGAWLTMLLGLVAGAMAAVPGWLDFRGIRNAAAAQVGRWHLGMNAVVVVLYVVNFAIRTRNPDYGVLPIGLSGISIAFLLVSGWLGAELVHVHGISVEGPRDAERVAIRTTGDGGQAPRRAGVTE